ncbi:SH3 domain-containing protein [Aeribacillus pallidus]|uniref:SH3 domain-containing protein n=1 Tax=Aeribacillus pallidus TaxID=33936 RepID=UPI003D1E339E
MQQFVKLIIILVLIFPTFSFRHVEANQQITINVNLLNVRQGPGLAYPVISQVSKNETYSVLQKQGDWYEIEWAKNKRGWVAGWLVKLNQTSSNPSSKGSVTVNGLRIRSGPSTNHAIVGHLYKGNVVTILSQSNGWYQVRYQSMEGWIHSDYLKLATATTTKNDDQSNTQTKREGIITVNRLNIRSGPAPTYSVIGQANKGDKVTIVNEQSGWYEILFGKKTAWVSGTYVELSKGAQKNSNENEQNSTSSAPPSTHSKLKGTITATSLNVRTEGSLNGKIIGSVKKGQTFSILDEKNQWYKIEFQPNQFGWVAGWFVQTSMEKDKAGISTEGTVKILYNGTNIRKEATVQSPVVARANAGETFPIIQQVGDWFHILLPDGTKAYIAGWIVSTEGKENTTSNPATKRNPLQNQTIVIDPGHGGRDSGAVGFNGTLEKTLTLQTAELLYEKLKLSGATVILTRKNDSYISLNSRVATSHLNDADAFISIHYDSINNLSVGGFTTYYYHSYQKRLAQSIHSKIASYVHLKDRGVKKGNYHVIRENKKPGALLELGYISNPTEELTVRASWYQDQVTSAIYEGLVNYFQ